MAKLWQSHMRPAVRDQIVDHGRHARRGREVEYVNRDECADVLARRNF